MIRESSVVIGMLAPFSGDWRGVLRHLLAGHSVRGARVVDVDELPSSVADSDGCRGDNEASRDSEGRHGSSHCWFSERQDQHGWQERESRGPHKLLRIFLVLLDRCLRNDPPDSILLTLTGIHRSKAGSEQHRLKREDCDPGALPNPTSPQRPSESDSQSRNHECEAQRQVHDGWM